MLIEGGDGNGNIKIYYEIFQFYNVPTGRRLFKTLTETKSISEYKDVVQKKTFALVYEVEYDGKTYKLLNSVLHETAST